jgi:cell wall-associated NlpC family hydrolase
MSREPEGEGSLEAMTLVERLGRTSTLRLSRSHRHVSVVTLILSVVLGLALNVGTPTRSSATSISQEKARAAVLYQQVQRINFHVQFLGQKFDLAHVKLETIIAKIRNTKSIVRSIEQNVIKGQKQLVSDAIFAFITNGAASSSNPLFSPDASKIGATNVYSTLAEGNVGAAIASLKNDRLQLTQEKGILRSEVAAARNQANRAKAAYRNAQALDATLQNDLASVKGSIASYYAAIAAAAAAKAAAALHASQSSPGSSSSVPGADPVAQIAIRTAESYLGTWYCWGGASRSCVDCSGLVMLAYDAAGIYFPHYSGAMYEDTEHIPLWDIQPGDLLFYGYDGDEHVAMYVGHGDMIEAEMTGTQVHIVPIRLGYGFAGVGRPRA